MIIVDTNVVSELLRASPNSAVEAWLATQAAGKVFLTTVSEAELRYGAAIMPAGKRRTLMMAAIDGVALPLNPAHGALGSVCCP